jgi:hypothetical protein
MHMVQLAEGKEVSFLVSRRIGADLHPSTGVVSSEIAGDITKWRLQSLVA